VRAGNTILQLTVLLASLSGAAAWCRADISVVDDASNRVTLEQPARRIIATAPHLAELVYAAGAGERLIATVRGADYPAEVLALPIVGDAAGLDFERIRQLGPDLILAWGSGNRPADLEHLTRDGVAVVVLEARALDDIALHLRVIGRLAGTEMAAERAATRYEQTLQQLRTRYAAACVINVFVEIWHQPVFTVGASHPLSDALRVCGARNALYDYPLLAGPVPVENVLMANAEVILSVTGMTEQDSQVRWNRLLPASRGQSVPVVAIAPELLIRPGPRMLNGIEALCARLEPLRESLCRADRSEK
jgi:iron complex transport system substrate-binding protein